MAVISHRWESVLKRFALVVGLFLALGMAGAAAAPSLGPVKTLSGSATPAVLPRVALQGQVGVAVWAELPLADGSRPSGRSAQGKFTWWVMRPAKLRSQPWVEL